jgi:hypothetical protein
MIESEDAMRISDLRDIDAPMLKKSRTEKEAPRRDTLLTENVLPRSAPSKTDSENKAPSLVKPQTASADPTRDKDLIDTEDPSWKKSITASDEAMRAMPLRDSVDPNRDIDLRDMEAPS